MSARINNNYMDSVLYRHWSSVSSSVSRRIERLSSGLRINRASDDASGIGISEKLRALASGLQVSMNNLQDGLSMLQTAQSSLDKVSVMLKRVRDLTVLASNGDKSDADRVHYQEEVDQILKEIDRLGKVSEYNTKKLLNGTLGKNARLVGDKDGVVEDINFQGRAENVASGEYKFRVVEAATHARAFITGKGRDSDSGEQAFTLNDKFLDFVGGASGNYSFKIESGGKSVTVELEANQSTTLGDTIQKINDTFREAGIDLTASLQADINDEGSGVVGDNDLLAAIQIESTYYGSSHDIRVSVVNQSSNVFSVNPLAAEGSEFTIYNSDLSDNNGRIDENIVIQAGDIRDDLNSLELLSDYANSSGEVVLNSAIIIEDGAGNIKTLDVDTTGNNKITLKDIVDALNSTTNGSYGGITVNISGSGFNVSAMYNAKEGKIELLDNSEVRKQNFKVSGVLAERLGIVGESNRSYKIEGQKITATRDFKLEVTSPSGEKISILGRYGTRDESFEFKGDTLKSSGVEGSDGGFGLGGIPGLELTLNNKKFRGGEKFSVLIEGGEVSLAGNPYGRKLSFELPEFTTKALGIENLNIKTQDNALNLLDSGKLDKAIEKVVRMETRIGGVSEGIKHEIHRLSVEYENIIAGESRIRDVDVGKEVMELTREQIIQQSGLKVLSMDRVDRSVIKALLEVI